MKHEKRRQIVRLPHPPPRPRWRGGGGGASPGGDRPPPHSGPRSGGRGGGARPAPVAVAHKYKNQMDDEKWRQIVRLGAGPPWAPGFRALSVVEWTCPAHVMAPDWPIGVIWGIVLSCDLRISLTFRRS